MSSGSLSSLQHTAAQGDCGQARDSSQGCALCQSSGSRRRPGRAGSQLLCSPEHRAENRASWASGALEPHVRRERGLLQEALRASTRAAAQVERAGGGGSLPLASGNETPEPPSAHPLTPPTPGPLVCSVNPRPSPPGQVTPTPTWTPVCSWVGSLDPGMLLRSRLGSA